MQNQLTGLAGKIELSVVSKKQISLASPQIKSQRMKEERKKGGVRGWKPINEKIKQNKNWKPQKGDISYCYSHSDKADFKSK